MIPAFNDEGYLPPGIHLATAQEMSARFGRDSELRRVQMESLLWLLELARRVNMELVDREAFEQFTQKTFATDRDLVPKGMIEVVL